MKKWASILAIGLIASSLQGVTTFAASPNGLTQSYSDMTNHWATDAVNQWSKREIVEGTGNHHFEPGRAITRAEWAAMLNRTFQLRSDSQTSFTDVKADAWYAEEVNTAADHGYMQGYEDHTFKPSALLTREQAAVSLAQLLKIQDAGSTVSFTDSSNLSAWSKEAVNKVVAQHIIQGYKDGTFAPQKSLTRAEAVTLLDRAVNYAGAWYGESGTYGPATGMKQQQGNVIINTPNVVLQNTEIAGDLIIGKNVGEGDVTLKNVKVHGQTYVYGGGEHSIHLDNSVLVSIIVDKIDGTVRLVAEGATTISEVKIKTGAALDVSAGAKVDRVTLTNQMPEKSTVRLNGFFNTVNVQAFNIKVDLPAGKIDEMNIADNAAGTTINTSSESSILSLVLNAAANVIGLGSIEKATVNAENVSFANKPKAFTTGSKVPANTTVAIGGKQESIGTSNSTSSTTSGGGGGSSTNSSSSGGSSNSGSSNSSSGGKKDDTKPSPQPNHPNTGDLKLMVPNTVVSVGDNVYFTSNHDGVAYFSSTSIDTEDASTLKLALESGESVKFDVRANETVTFSTYNIRNWSYPSNYEFYLDVYDTQGHAAYEEIIVLDENETLTDSPLLSKSLVDKNERDEFWFEYNRLISLTKGRSLNDIIEWSVDGQAFQPFTSANGQISIINNSIYFVPNHLEARKRYSFKLKANSIQTKDGQQNQEIIHSDNKKTVYTTMITPSEQPYQVKQGDEITFKLTDTSTVYLINTFVIGSSFNYEDMVDQHWATKTIVDEEHVELPVTISTLDLPTGRYKLDVWDGINIDIEIVK